MLFRRDELVAPFTGRGGAVGIDAGFQFIALGGKIAVELGFRPGAVGRNLFCQRLASVNQRRLLRREFLSGLFLRPVAFVRRLRQSWELSRTLFLAALFDAPGDIGVDRLIARKVLIFDNARRGKAREIAGFAACQHDTNPARYRKPGEAQQTGLFYTGHGAIL